MIISKFLTMKSVFTFLLSASLIGISYSRDVFDDHIGKTSNISVVPFSYDTEVYYNDDLLYGEEKVIGEGSIGYKITGTDIVVLEPINRVVEIGRGPISISYGSTTGYGANCVGCSGNVACSTNYGTHSLINDGVYYEDSKYGNVRIVAADNSLYPCGTIISIDNGVMDPFMGIVLDTGGAMRNAWQNGNILIDIAFSYEDSKGIYDATNMDGSVKFKVYRVGW